MTATPATFEIGAWCWSVSRRAVARIVDRREVWGEVAYRLWLPTTDEMARATPTDIVALDTVRLETEHVLHATASAKVLEGLAGDLLLAPIHSSVVPLPHQLYALNRAMSHERIRYLFADEVGLGKTIEAGLVLRELKLRGRARRILVVVPKGLIRQWQAELQLHFGEHFRFVDPAELAAFRTWARHGTGHADTLWQAHDQVICSLDSVKPIEGRRGWTSEQVHVYNRERFEDLVSAAWDLVIIDEAHRLGGSTDQVARYRLGATLAAAAPYVLLLSATPHQGKTDQFTRLMQMLDPEAFPDERSVTRERVQPFIVRTEKRAAITADGQPLFKPRVTRLQGVAWASSHQLQQRLYEAVTQYVRHGYNRALATQQRHIGFLMILMQRLVTSSTAAIRTTLERRQAVLESPDLQTTLFDASVVDEWAELDGDAQANLAVRMGGWEQETTEVQNLLALARETEGAATDAKAEALVDLIYQLQQEERDPAIKVLVFTEFLPTQAMLADYLGQRGFSVATLNGSMDLEARSDAQRRFASDARVLVSTDAGGEGLNLQFCHVVVNFDMPWNPMRVEQRIGRVDRIGQTHVVRAINFVLEDTVEYRVRQVLEEKLAIIAQEFGVDKAADVMDSVAVDPVFDSAFMQAVADPDGVAAHCDAAVEELREQLAEARAAQAVLGPGEPVDATTARAWRDHPAQHWLERAVVNGIGVSGGEASPVGAGWKLRWPDGSVSLRACFEARVASAQPELEWVTMEDARVRGLVNAVPRFVRGQALPVVRVVNMPATVRGAWALWEVAIETTDGHHARYLPTFVSEDGRSLGPTAVRVWDLLLSQDVTVTGALDVTESERWYTASASVAESQGRDVVRELIARHRAEGKAQREQAELAFAARADVIGRIGLANVRAHRLRQLEVSRRERLAAVERGAAVTPELNAVLVLWLAAEGGQAG